MSFIIKEATQSLLTVFAIIALGYLIGAIKIKGIGLGTAAIFLSGLLFGHFGAKTPAVLQTVGLILFITSVGLSAGPSFVQRLKLNGKSYVLLCLTIALTGALVCSAIIKLAGVEAPLAVGIMTGAFTTSPGFAAAKEAVSANPEAVATVAAGYGIAYPVGVVCKVLAIQLIPKLLHADMAKERALIALPSRPEKTERSNPKRLDAWGLLPFSMAVVLGILLGSVTIALPGGGSFALGTTGGPLIVGLLIGHIGHIGGDRPDAFLLRCRRRGRTWPRGHSLQLRGFPAPLWSAAGGHSSYGRVSGFSQIAKAAASKRAWFFDSQHDLHAFFGGADPDGGNRRRSRGLRHDLSHCADHAGFTGTIPCYFIIAVHSFSIIIDRGNAC